MTKTEFKSPTSDHRSLLTQQTTTLSPNKLLETTIDVNTNPEGKKSDYKYYLINYFSESD